MDIFTRLLIVLDGLEGLLVGALLLILLLFLRVIIELIHLIHAVFIIVVHLLILKLLVPACLILSSSRLLSVASFLLGSWSSPEGPAEPAATRTLLFLAAFVIIFLTFFFRLLFLLINLLFIALRHPNGAHRHALDNLKWIQYPWQAIAGRLTASASRHSVSHTSSFTTHCLQVLLKLICIKMSFMKRE